ncbi:hypothetical protein OUZ56_027846 [Daphnia magna]|uniref:Uncharacterized protein n=1 Tax=Daphnia magna TaxID=35525 RepID=A0ABR0B238_9CRUS|nr:hypothetical protein OUZ56_027846 [Daphnia magna]
MSENCEADEEQGRSGRELFFCRLHNFSPYGRYPYVIRRFINHFRLQTKSISLISSVSSSAFHTPLALFTCFHNIITQGTLLKTRFRAGRVDLLDFTTTFTRDHHHIIYINKQMTGTKRSSWNLGVFCENPAKWF